MRETEITDVQNPRRAEAVCQRHVQRRSPLSLGIGATAAGNTSGGRVMLVWESRSRQPF